MTLVVYRNLHAAGSSWDADDLSTDTGLPADVHSKFDLAAGAVCALCPALGAVLSCACLTVMLASLVLGAGLSHAQPQAVVSLS